MTEALVISVEDAAGVAHDVATLSAIAAILGALTDAPAAFTLLARLKDLKASVDAGNTILGTQAQYLDGVEGLIGTSNTSLASILAALNLSLGYQDGLEGLIGTGNSALTSILGALTTSLGYQDGLETLIGATNTSLTALLAANRIQVVDQKSSAYGATAQITRGADVTPYSAGDVVGGPLTFANMGPSGLPIVITCASIEMDIAALAAGTLSNFRLYFYNVTPPSALADNAVFDLPAGDRAGFLGFVDIGTPVDLGATIYGEVLNINKQLKLATTDLFAYLVTTGGFTPGNGDVYKPKLHSLAV